VFVEVLKDIVKLSHLSHILWLYKDGTFEIYTQCTSMAFIPVWAPTSEATS